MPRPSRGARCRHGRVAIPVALETGRPVIGVDIVAAMLAQARVRAEQAGAELVVREEDMRDLTLDEPAALVYRPFRGSCTCRRGTTNVASSSVSRRASCQDALRGTSSASITRSARLDGSTNRSRSRTRFATRRATTASTSHWTRRADIALVGEKSEEWEGLIDVAGLQVEASRLVRPAAVRRESRSS